MRHARSFLLLTVSLLAFCQREPRRAAPAAPAKVPGAIVTDMGTRKVNGVIAPDKLMFFNRSLLGSQLDAQGQVAKESLEFKRGEPIALTMWIRTSPAGLQTSAVWTGEKNKEIVREAKSMQGSLVATFQAPKLPPGRYHVTGYWGGNFACEYDFQVTGKITNPKKKK